MTETEKVAAMEKTEDWFFTFGYGHAHPNCYVKIHGTFNSARELMHRMYGPKWAFQYDSKEFPAIAKRWGMKEVM